MKGFANFFLYCKAFLTVLRQHPACKYLLKQLLKEDCEGGKFYLSYHFSIYFYFTLKKPKLKLNLQTKTSLIHKLKT